jgi:hypothetical protein
LLKRMPTRACSVTPNPPGRGRCGLGIVRQVTSHAATTATHKFANRIWAQRRHHLVLQLLRVDEVLDDPERPPRGRPAAPPCTASSSPSRPDSPDHNAAECCTCRRTGPDPGNGPHYGTRRPDHPPQPELRTQRPRPLWKSCADQPISATHPPANHLQDHLVELKITRDPGPTDRGLTAQLPVRRREPG